MKTTLFLMLTLVVGGSLASERAKMEIKKSYGVENPTEFKLLVDNIQGDVIVEGYDGSEIIIDLEILITARNSSHVEQAKSELDLRERLDDGELQLSMEAPFVEYWKEGEFRSRRIVESPPYDYKYNFFLKVPRSMAVMASTINDGQVRVKGVLGDLEVRNVNGSISIRDAKEVLEASTVNGFVDVEYAENPSKNGSFHTINGNITLYMQPSPMMSVAAETMNGEMFSAFEFETLPAVLKVNEKRRGNGMEYKLEEKVAVKIGEGNGPELRFKTLNGDIYLRKI